MFMYVRGNCTLNKLDFQDFLYKKEEKKKLLFFFKKQSYEFSKFNKVLVYGKKPPYELKPIH